MNSMEATFGLVGLVMIIVLILLQRKVDHLQRRVDDLEQRTKHLSASDH